MATGAHPLRRLCSLAPRPENSVMVRPVSTPKRIAALAGGVGGAKLAHGLAQALPSSNLTVIVNTGDDFEHLGFQISPDLDTVTYTLAGLSNPDTGWGVAGDTFEFLGALKRLGGSVVVRPRRPRHRDARRADPAACSRREPYSGYAGPVHGSRRGPHRAADVG